MKAEEWAYLEVRHACLPEDCFRSWFTQIASYVPCHLVKTFITEILLIVFSQVPRCWASERYHGICTRTRLCQVGQLGDTLIWTQSYMILECWSLLHAIIRCFQDVARHSSCYSPCTCLKNSFNAEHSGQTSNKAAWQQYSGPTHENTDTSKPKGPEQSSKEH